MKTILLVIITLTFSACHQVNPVISNNVHQCNALSIESDISLNYQNGYSYDIVTEDNVDTINEYYDLNVSINDIVYGYCGLED